MQNVIGLTTQHDSFSSDASGERSTDAGMFFLSGKIAIRGIENTHTLLYFTLGGYSHSLGFEIVVSRASQQLAFCRDTPANQSDKLVRACGCVTEKGEVD